MGKGANLVVGADVAAITLAGIDRGTGVNDGILQQGVGADDAVRADDRLAAQDAARQDGGTGGDDDLRLNANVITDKIHAVIQMALKRGGIALLCQLEILSCGGHIAVLPLYTHFVPAAHGGCRRTLYLYITPEQCLSLPCGACIEAILPKNAVRRKNLPRRSKEKSDSSKNISNFPPIIIYTIFVQIAIPEPKKFGYFSAKLLSIFLTIYWKSVFRSVIMDYANMIYVMQTRHQFGR